MHTVFALCALWGSVSPQLSQFSMNFENDYREARAIGAKSQKPLLVFVGQGADGWKRLVREGQLGGEARSKISAAFIAVYIDRTAEDGKSLAEAFSLQANGGLIISDRSGGVMAFRHEGPLSDADLCKHLTRFADPALVVATTEGKGLQSPKSVLPLEEINFQSDVLDDAGPVLVDFSAPWCGPCRMMDPVMDSLGREFKVRKVNIDHNQSLVARFQVASVPTILIFKGGRLHRRHQGIVAESTLRTELSSLSDGR